MVTEQIFFFFFSFALLQKNAIQTEVKASENFNNKEAGGNVDTRHALEVHSSW